MKQKADLEARKAAQEAKDLAAQQEQLEEAAYVQAEAQAKWSIRAELAARERRARPSSAPSQREARTCGGALPGWMRGGGARRTSLRSRKTAAATTARSMAKLPPSASGEMSSRIPLSPATIRVRLT